MINKNSFVKIMDALRDYDDALCVMYNNLGLNMDDNVFTRVLDQTLSALVEDVEPNFDARIDGTPLCHYYAFDCNWGRKEPKEDGFTSAEELYDNLVAEKELYEHVYGKVCKEE